MELARYVVDAVVLEGRSYRDVAQAHGVSKSWVGKVIGRFRDGGYEAIGQRSRAPNRIPHRTPSALEDEIVTLRKGLADQGLDAGAETIHHHLSSRHAGPRSRRSGACCAVEGSSPLSRTNDLAARGSVSRPGSPTSAGSPTSPTGALPTGPRSTS